MGTGNNGGRGKAAARMNRVGIIGRPTEPQAHRRAERVPTCVCVCALVRAYMRTQRHDRTQYQDSGSRCDGVPANALPRARARSPKAHSPVARTPRGPLTSLPASQRTPLDGRRRRPRCSRCRPSRQPSRAQAAHPHLCSGSGSRQASKSADGAFRAGGEPMWDLDSGEAEWGRAGKGMESNAGDAKQRIEAATQRARYGTWHIRHGEIRYGPTTRAQTISVVGRDWALVVIISEHEADGTYARAGRMAILRSAKRAGRTDVDENRREVV